MTKTLVHAVVAAATYTAYTGRVAVGVSEEKACAAEALG